MLTGPVVPVEVFFYWPEAVFWNFYWPGAIGSPLASSPAASLSLLAWFSQQGLSQDLETGCLKLAIVKFLGVQMLKGDHNILRFQQ